jgi:hypothetical protein
LQADGAYFRPTPGEPPFRVQEELLRLPVDPRANGEKLENLPLSTPVADAPFADRLAAEAKF